MGRASAGLGSPWTPSQNPSFNDITFRRKPTTCNAYRPTAEGSSPCASLAHRKVLGSSNDDCNFKVVTSSSGILRLCHNSPVTGGPATQTADESSVLPTLSGATV